MDILTYFKDFDDIERFLSELYKNEDLKKIKEAPIPNANSIHITINDIPTCKSITISGGDGFAKITFNHLFSIYKFPDNDKEFDLRRRVYDWEIDEEVKDKDYHPDRIKQMLFFIDRFCGKKWLERVLRFNHFLTFEDFIQSDSMRLVFRD